MKTLDEVIEEVERCHCNITDGCGTCEEFRKCFFCVSEYPSCDPLNDALHYLKEYRNCGDCAYADSYLRCTAENRNDPLTWDELRQMERKPVFVEERYRNGDLKSAGWWLIDYWYDDQICLRDQGGNLWNAHRTSLGRDWQAYRKERNENAE